MKTWVLIPLLLGAALAAHWAAAEEPQAKRWWELRHDRPDLYFRHEKHRDALAASGDLCLACHPFNATRETDAATVQTLTAIANEPLAPICHECHMADRSAPIDCRVCHPDPATV